MDGGEKQRRGNAKETWLTAGLCVFSVSVFPPLWIQSLMRMSAAPRSNTAAWGGFQLELSKAFETAPCGAGTVGRLGKHSHGDSGGSLSLNLVLLSLLSLLFSWKHKPRF